MNCKHCGKQIEKQENPNGYVWWVHEYSGLINCNLVAAPETDEQTEVKQ